MKASLWGGLFLLLIAISPGSAQTLFPKGSIYLEGGFGLSFYNRDLAYINGQIPPHYNMNNSIRFSLTPKINYALASNLMISGHLGLDFNHYKSVSDGHTFRAANFRVGGGMKYYYPIIGPFYLDVEVGLNYNNYHMNSSLFAISQRHQNLLQAYLDVGLNLFITDDLFMAVVFKNLIDYHTDLPNFEHRRNWKINNVLKELIRFPHFSIGYRIE